MQASVVFCADKNYGTYLPVAVESIIKNASPEHEYHIIIFDCGIKAKDSAVLKRQIAKHKNFTLITKSITAAVDKYSQAFYVKRGHYLSAAAYGRLLIPELCGEYEKVIYADVDMIFDRDIAELMNIDFALTSGNREQGTGNREQGTDYIAGVSDVQTPEWLKSDFPAGSYINSGLLVFNITEWRKHNLTQKAIKLLTAKRLRKHDQDAINILCKDKIIYLSGIWNRISGTDTDFPDNKCVFHYVDAVKPWHKFYSSPANRWWHYARKTEIYEQLKQGAQQNKAGLNLEKKDLYHSFCGIPLIHVKIRPLSKKYYLFALRSFHFAESRINLKTGRRNFYFYHIRVFSREIK